MTQTTFNIAVSGDDGYVQRTDSVYPPAGLYTIDDTGINVHVYRRFIAGPTYDVFVGLLRWDTSSIPDGSTITGAVLRVYITGTGNADSRNLTAEWYDSGTIGTEDWTNTVGTNAHAGVSISSITTSAYNDFGLQNVSNVSVTGYTGLRLHISGAVPTGQNFVSIASFDDTTFIEPRLIVDYTPPNSIFFFKA